MRYSNLKDNLSAEELLADGVMGYLKGIDHFDVSKGVRLNSYAGFWIMNHLSRSDLLNDQIRLPYHQRENVSAINKALIELQDDGIYNPTDEQISDYSNVNVKHIKQIKQYLGGDQYISIHDPIADDTDMTWQDRIPDPNIKNQQHIEDMNLDIENLLSLLPEMHSFVLSRSFGIPEKWSLHKLGIKFGKSRERMRQIREVALHALKTHIRLWQEYDFYRQQDPKENVKLLIKRRKFVIGNLEKRRKLEQEQNEAKRQKQKEEERQQEESKRMYAEGFISQEDLITDEDDEYDDLPPFKEYDCPLP